ncbi:hypothetical protein [uncultured Sphingomonas sp.]|uniref:hypothetical protein n=1 Tax=uncultured Sphingomonas sp. TaxID=158754 RepID=UPI0025D79657|nr:hypothetical protein [uncultured Sphingomonas sp.]
MVEEVEDSEVGYQERIDRLTTTLLTTLGKSLTLFGEISLGIRSPLSPEEIVAAQRNLLARVQEADEFECIKAVEASIEMIFGSLKALVGGDLLGTLAAGEDGNRGGRVAAARRIVSAIRKAIDTDPAAPPSPLAQLDDGLRALLAGETTDMLTAGERVGKYRNAYSVRRIQYMAVALRSMLIDAGVSANKASALFQGSFHGQWDTARKWQEANKDLISPYDARLWEEQLAVMVDQTSDPVAAICAALEALGKSYIEELKRR